MEEELILEEQDRSKLDGIVQQMESNGEKSEAIEFVVSDFKSKYGKSTEPVKKKEESEVSEPLVSESTSTLVFQEIDIPEVDPEMQPLFDEYLKSSTLSDEQFKDIEEYQEGKRSIWGHAKAFARGFLDAGMVVPIYNFDTKETLVEKQEEKNKINFIEDLPDQDKAKLLETVQDSGYNLDKVNTNVAIEQRAMEQKAKEISEKYGELTTEDAKALSKEEQLQLLEDFKELQSIQHKYNDNVDIIESNDENITTFKEEINLLKRNYKGLDNFIGKVVNSTRSLIAGGIEASSTFGEIMSLGLAPNEASEIASKKAEEIRQNANKFNELLRPSIDVNDIDTPEDFGEWISEQIATQIPVITALVATGPTTGSVLLGASSGGQKSLELKEENRNGADYSNMEIFLASTGNGALEFLSERVTGGILSKGKRTLKAAVAGKQRKAVMKGVGNTMKSMVADVGSEGLSEGMSQLGQNMIDKFYLDKKEVGLFDGVENAIASGGVLGGMMNAVPTLTGAALSRYQSTESKSKLKTNTAKLKAIQEQLGKEDLDPDVKTEIESLQKSIIRENKKVFKETIDNVESKSPEDLKEVSKLDKQIAKEVNKAKKIVKNPDIPKPVREDISTRMLKKIQDKKARKEEILDPKNESNPIDKKNRDINILPIKKKETESKTNIDKSGTANLKEELKNLGVDSKIIDAISDNVALEYKDLNKQKIPGFKKARMVGFYGHLNSINKKQKIVLDQSIKDTPFGVESLIHESIHAATVFVLDKVIDNKKNDIKDSDITADQKRAIGDLNAIYKNYRDYLSKNTKEIRLLYGFTDIKEFVAEFISNPNFRDYIERTKPKTKIGTSSLIIDSLIKSPIQSIWKNVLKLLGIKLNSAGAKRIMAIEHNIDKVLEAQKSIQQKVKNDKNFEGDNNITFAYTQSKTPKTSFKTEMKRLFLSGFPVLTYLDEKVSERIIGKPLEKATTKAIKRGLDSKSKLKRSISQGAVSWFNGLARTDKEVAAKRRLEGRQESAYVRGAKLTKQLQQLIDFNPESNERVHKVMDSELYEEADRITYDELTDNEKDLHDMLREINDATHNLNFEEGFIDEKTYNKFKDKYIGRGYEVYEDQASQEKSGIINNKIFKDIYKKRKEIDQWKIDNKVKDPIYLTINRMIRSERNVAVKNYADGIVANGQAIDDPKPGYTQMKGKGYGSLEGKYVPNHIAEDFQGFFFVNSLVDKLYDVAKAYDKTVYRQLLKRYHTVYSPVVQIGNFMSNHAFAFAAGINIVQLWNELPASRKDIKTKDGDYMKLLEEGIIGSNILTPDLKLSEESQKKLKLSSKNKIKKFIIKADDKAKQLYAGSDDIMKLSAYKALRKMDYTHDQAIQRVYEGFQNYSTVGKLWDFSSKLPAFGRPFVKFQADLQRIMKNAVTKRPLTTASFLISLSWMIGQASKASGESEEEREIREGRAYIPKILNPIGKDIPLVLKAGNKEINLARFISPYYNYDIPNQGWLETLSNFTPLGLDEFESAEMGQQSVLPAADDVLLGPFIQAFLYNKDFRQKSVTDPFASRYKESGLTGFEDEIINEKFINQLEYTSRSVAPLFAPLQDMWLTYHYGEDYYKRSKTLSDAVLSKVIKIQTLDDKSLQKVIESSVNNIEYKEKSINNKIKAVSSKYEKDLEIEVKRLKEGKITQTQFNKKMEKLYDKALRRESIHLENLSKEQEKMNKLIENIKGVKYNEK